MFRGFYLQFSVVKCIVVIEYVYSNNRFGITFCVISKCNHRIIILINNLQYCKHEISNQKSNNIIFENCRKFYMNSMKFFWLRRIFDRKFFFRLSTFIPFANLLTIFHFFFFIQLN